MNFYRILDHTADLEIMVTGSNLEDLFRNSFSATADLIFDIGTLKVTVKKTFQLKFIDLKEAMVKLLGIILMNVDSNSVLFFCIYDLKISGDTLSGSAGGTKISSHMEPKNLIKAITYHDLYIDPSGKSAKILFDI
ncbi:MAG: archease [Thermoplasmataceae archaeon]|jgi:SHS2 domain-containing protein